MRLLLLPCLLLASFGFGQSPAKISLAEAIRIAELNNPAYQASKSDLDASRAGARATRARTGPQVSANGFATNGNNPSIFSSSPMVEPPVWMSVPTGSYFDGNLMVMVPIFAPSLQAKVSSANWEAKAAKGEIAESLADLRLQVTDAYDRVLLARQMVAAAEAKIAASQELVRTTQNLFEAGKGIEATVSRTRAELSQAERALTSAKNDEAKAILDLQALMGADMSSPIDPSDSLSGTTSSDTLDRLLIQGKRDRGMVLAARAKREAASAELRAAEGQGKPQLYGVAMGDATNRRDMGGVSAGLTLSLPLFDGGRIRAEAAQAKSMRAKAEAQLRQTEITVEKEIRQAWLDRDTARANATSAEAAVKAAESAYEVTTMRVSAGKSIVVEQLDALEALTRARADLAQARFDQVLAEARLMRAAGGTK